MSALVTELATEAQINVLGSMLIDQETVGPLLHQLTAEDFIEGRYRNIFQAIKKLRGQGKDPDPLLVNDALGGNYREILAGLMEVTPTSANAEAYAEVLHRAALQYHLAELGEQLTAAAASSLDEARAVADKITALSCEKPGVRITDLRQCYEEFLDRHAEGKKPAYFTWGIPALDERIYVEPGDFTVLGGYPSAGKTALALQMAFHIAEKKRVGYFYFENNDRKLFDRLVALRAKVSFGKIKRFDLQEEDFEQIVAVQDSLVAPDLKFVDASGMTAEDIRALALSRRYELVVVDYLQKIPASRGRRDLSDFERVSEVSDALQNLGRQTGTAVLALSQLSRPNGAKAAEPGMHAFLQTWGEDMARYFLTFCRHYHLDPRRLTRYLEHNCVVDSDLPWMDIADVFDEYRDYLEAAYLLGWCLEHSRVLFPENLRSAHDQATRQLLHCQSSAAAGKAAAKGAERLKKYSFELDGLRIVFPLTAASIRREGRVLAHCVGGYAERHLKGVLTILFLRKVREPNTPYVTIEMDGNTIRQIHGYDNEMDGRASPRKVHKEFLDAWLAWLKAGSRRDKDGKPVLPKRE